MKKGMLLLAAFLFLVGGAITVARADDDEHEEHGTHKEHEERSWYQKIFSGKDDTDLTPSEHKKKGFLPPVDNPTYKEQCGACHFAFQPGLLPSGSWEKILDTPGEHNGEEIELDPESKDAIAEYLNKNAAEHSSAKRAVKIMKSLDGQTPLRITDTPYIQNKHKSIPRHAFLRESIGSRSNCPACHTTAEKGIYREKSVTIPL